MSRTYTISFRCSPAEQAALVQLAARLGGNESEACRWAIQHAVRQLNVLDAADGESEHGDEVFLSPSCLEQATPVSRRVLAILTALLPPVPPIEQVLSKRSQNDRTKR